jgi:hypothetical protein
MALTLTPRYQVNAKPLKKAVLSKSSSDAREDQINHGIKSNTVFAKRVAKIRCFELELNRGAFIQKT